MKNKIKKYILGLSTIVGVSVPLTTVISCGENQNIASALDPSADPAEEVIKKEIVLAPLNKVLDIKENDDESIMYKQIQLRSKGDKLYYIIDVLNRLTNENDNVILSHSDYEKMMRLLTSGIAILPPGVSQIFSYDLVTSNNFKHIIALLPKLISAIDHVSILAQKEFNELDFTLIKSVITPFVDPLANFIKTYVSNNFSEDPALIVIINQIIDDFITNLKSHSLLDSSFMLLNALGSHIQEIKQALSPLLNSQSWNDDSMSLIAFGLEIILKAPSLEALKPLLTLISPILANILPVNESAHGDNQDIVVAPPTSTVANVLGYQGHEPWTDDEKILFIHNHWQNNPLKYISEVLDRLVNQDNYHSLTLNVADYSALVNIFVKAGASEEIFNLFTYSIVSGPTWVNIRAFLPKIFSFLAQGIQGIDLLLDSLPTVDRIGLLNLLIDSIKTQVENFNPILKSLLTSFVNYLQNYIEDSTSLENWLAPLLKEVVKIAEIIAPLAKFAFEKLTTSEIFENFINNFLLKNEKIIDIIENSENIFSLITSFDISSLLKPDFSQLGSIVELEDSQYSFTLQSAVEEVAIDNEQANEGEQVAEVDSTSATTFDPQSLLGGSMLLEAVFASINNAPMDEKMNIYFTLAKNLLGGFYLELAGHKDEILKNGQLGNDAWNISNHPSWFSDNLPTNVPLITPLSEIMDQSRAEELLTNYGMKTFGDYIYALQQQKSLTSFYTIIPALFLIAGSIIQNDFIPGNSHMYSLQEELMGLSEYMFLPVFNNDFTYGDDTTYLLLRDNILPHWFLAENQKQAEKNAAQIKIAAVVADDIDGATAQKLHDITLKINNFFLNDDTDSEKLWIYEHFKDQVNDNLVNKLHILKNTNSQLRSVMQEQIQRQLLTNYGDDLLQISKDLLVDLEIISQEEADLFFDNIGIMENTQRKFVFNMAAFALLLNDLSGSGVPENSNINDFNQLFSSDDTQLFNDRFNENFESMYGQVIEPIKNWWDFQLND